MAQSVQVEFTPEFKRNIRQLAKKYRHLQADVQPVITQLEAGQTPGIQIPRTGYTVFKVRVKNSDIQKGKRSGYRMIVRGHRGVSINGARKDRAGVPGTSCSLRQPARYRSTGHANGTFRAATGSVPPSGYP
jgi:mRNA-degrading endonuclease RelE of RelBE toxin-antitoxin system